MLYLDVPWLIPIFLRFIDSSGVLWFVIFPVPMINLEESSYWYFHISQLVCLAAPYRCTEAVNNCVSFGLRE